MQYACPFNRKKDDQNLCIVSLSMENSNFCFFHSSERLFQLSFPLLLSVNKPPATVLNALISMCFVFFLSRHFELFLEAIFRFVVVSRFGFKAISCIFHLLFIALYLIFFSLLSSISFSSLGRGSLDQPMQFSFVVWKWHRTMLNDIDINNRNE